jgi:carbon monoxide dehydrogenase subunit G
MENIMMTVKPQAQMITRPIVVARCIPGVEKIRRHCSRIEILTKFSAKLYVRMLA